jgi:hypothetical protein
MPAAGAQHRGAHRPAEDANALRDQWPTLGLDHKRAIVRAVFDRIVIKPVVKGRNRFDISRVEPVWRE